ncbi:MAG: hypothetical protein NTW94_09290 [Legionellales bacterium]|nr:hypothetical protein [Legionellales bacterium]
MRSQDEKGQKSSELEEFVAGSTSLETIEHRRALEEQWVAFTDRGKSRITEDPKQIKILNQYITEIIKFGANVRVQQKDGFTPLHYALSQDNDVMFNNLIKAGKIDTNDPRVITELLEPLLFTAYFGGCKKVEKFLTGLGLTSPSGEALRRELSPRPPLGGGSAEVEPPRGDDFVDVSLAIEEVPKSSVSFVDKFRDFKRDFKRDYLGARNNPRQILENVSQSIKAAGDLEALRTVVSNFQASKDYAVLSLPKDSKDLVAEFEAMVEGRRTEIGKSLGSRDRDTPS